MIKIQTNLLNKKLQILDIIIKFGNIEDYDFKIIQKNNNYNQKDLLIKTLKTLFSSADRRYKVIFEDLIFVPINYTDSEYYGIINFKNNKIEKYCSYEKNNIGFCVYGKTKLYLQGAIKNEFQYNQENYNCLFYTRKDIDINVKNRLKNTIECCDMPGWFMMFTRFYPVENPNNNIYMSRDTDCRLSKRELSCIEDWLQSKKTLHIIRDHPYHTTEILGGLWGFQNNNIPDLRFQIAKWCIEFVKNNKIYQKGPDQFFLKKLYQKYHKDAYIQDSYLNYENKNIKNIIRGKRKGKEYLGEAFDENDNILHIYLRNYIK
jgi:hypothetical protein